MVGTQVELDKVYSLQKTPSLDEMYYEIGLLVKNKHKDLYNQENHMTYHPISGDIIDGYKNILHVMLLSRIPNFKYDNTINYKQLIKDMFRRLEIDTTKEKIDEVELNIKSIVDKNCGVLTLVKLSAQTR